MLRARLCREEEIRYHASAVVKGRKIKTSVRRWTGEIELKNTGNQHTRHCRQGAARCWGRRGGREAYALVKAGRG
ncbi:hypothetical protein IF1G_00105 [Cordyceps javanica]|uniref:Uncharacterized protein n=1 Tax=Cordyceps javanica TaxID=43265 RepID=A0A545VEM1_9HYPO|nr:hypothetical protein IF1G_00105 [Cordyceps javanica]